MSTVLDAAEMERAFRSEMLDEYSAARDAFASLRGLARAAGTVYGDALTLVFERRLETAQERYEDALRAAERLIEEQAKRVAKLIANLTEEPF